MKSLTIFNFIFGRKTAGFFYPFRAVVFRIIIKFKIFAFFTIILQKLYSKKVVITPIK